VTVINPFNYAKPNNFVRDEDFQQKEPDKIVNISAKKKFKDQSSQYLENRIMSAKPEELTYMLYEGLVKFIKKSILHLEEKNYEQVNYYTQRAQAIIEELRATLNHEIDLSYNLEQLYEYMSNKLVNANVHKDKELYLEALTISEEFKDTWQRAFDIKF